MMKKNRTINKKICYSMEEFEKKYFPNSYKKRIINFQEEDKDEMSYTLSKLMFEEVTEES